MCTLWLPEGAVHGAPLVAGPTSVAGSPVVMVLVAGPTSAAVVAGGDGAGRCQMVDLVLGAAGRHWPLVLHGAPLVAGAAGRHWPLATGRWCHWPLAAGRHWPLVPLVASGRWCRWSPLAAGAAGRHWPLVQYLRYTIVCNGIPLKMAGGRSQCDPYID